MKHNRVLTNRRVRGLEHEMCKKRGYGDLDREITFFGSFFENPFLSCPLIWSISLSPLSKDSR